MASSAGEGDSCCGNKPYFNTTHTCCQGYIPAIHLVTYTVADACCMFGQRGYNKSYQVCCNDYKIGNGNACCNKNGDENYNEEIDVPYYDTEKCCVAGKLVDQACKNSAINKFFSLFFNISFLIIVFLFHLKSN